MSKHTPGPWFTGGNYGEHGVEIVGDDGNRRVCGIAHVERDLRDPDGRKTGTAPIERGLADARLIAAAPDLLEALVGLFADGSGISYANWTPEQHAAHAAIAKARGEQ